MSAGFAGCREGSISGVHTRTPLCLPISQYIEALFFDIAVCRTRRWHPVHNSGSKLTMQNGMVLRQRTRCQAAIEIDEWHPSLDQNVGEHTGPIVVGTDQAETTGYACDEFHILLLIRVDRYADSR